MALKDDILKQIGCICVSAVTITALVTGQATTEVLITSIVAIGGISGYSLKLSKNNAGR